MKILVTGASGLLGRSLMVALQPLVDTPEALVGTARSRLSATLQRLDLTDAQAVREAYARWSPTLIVHCAAERRPDVVDGDPRAAQELNVGATRLLGELAAGAAARFIYISTDYVFDGQTPPYAPEARPAPLNAYGRMKLAGEEGVREAYGPHGGNDFAILRIPILYGRVQTLAESPVTELAVKLLAGKPHQAEDWALRYPAHADDVARAVALIASQLMASPHAGGIYHYGGGETYTKYGMARVIAQALGVDAGLVSPDARPPSGAPRPKDCRLDASRLAALGFTPAIRFAEGVRQALLPLVR